MFSSVARCKKQVETRLTSWTLEHAQQINKEFGWPKLKGKTYLRKTFKKTWKYQKPNMLKIPQVKFDSTIIINANHRCQSYQ